MHTARTLQTLVIAASLLASASASAASAAISSGPVPQVVISAKRLTMQEKIRMTLEDVADAAKRLAGMPQKNSKPAGNLG